MEQHDKRPGFLDISRHFNPAWFASVMGTAVIPLAFSFVTFPFRDELAAFFIYLSAVMFALAIGPWVFRFFAYPKEVRADFNHPIAANFFPTMPISLIILALDLLKYPELLFNREVSHHLALYLWIIGSVGIYVFGFIILINIFSHREIKLNHANFGWYIPPVSKLIIPVAGFELATVLPWTMEFTFGLSIISFGVGFFLFIFVGAAVYHRYIYHELPMSRFASTFFIGIAPTAIIGVILLKMIHFFNHHQIMGITPEQFAPIAKLSILLNWGFSLWWFIMALIVMMYYIKKLDLPYALSWWAFTFPLGAQSVATGAAWNVSGFSFIPAIYFFTLFLMGILWILVSIRTIRGIISGQIFKPAH